MSEAAHLCHDKIVARDRGAVHVCLKGSKSRTRGAERDKNLRKNKERSTSLGTRGVVGSNPIAPTSPSGKVLILQLFPKTMYK